MRGLTELLKLLNSGNRFRTEEDKKRASQILKAVEGLSIWEARELLENCATVLQLLEIHYRRSSDATTS